MGTETGLKPSELLAKYSGHDIVDVDAAVAHLVPDIGYDPATDELLQGEVRMKLWSATPAQTMLEISRDPRGGQLSAAADGSRRLIAGFRLSRALCLLLGVESVGRNMSGRGSSYRADQAALERAGF